MKVLAGDIGGTNARLAVIEIGGGRYQTQVAETFPSRQYSSLEEIVRTFTDAQGVRCQRACFGVPGPVKDGRAQITNLAWVVEAFELAAGARRSSAWPSSTTWKPRPTAYRPS